MNIDKNCPKCSNRMGIACNKCYECGYDYFSGYEQTKPQTKEIEKILKT